MSGRISFDRLTAYWRDLIGDPNVGQVNYRLSFLDDAKPEPLPEPDPDFRYWIILENPHFGWPDDLVEEARQARDWHMQKLQDGIRKDQQDRNTFPFLESDIAGIEIRPRFKSMPGGAVIEVETGRAMAHVAVTQLDTTTAQRVSEAIIATLEATQS